jgi:hypothetical protein
MAITINDQPYPWAVRGQKLMIIATSDETAQPGFRYGVEVLLNGTPYTFYVAAAPDTRLYFDVQSLVNDMRNSEPLNYHLSTDNTISDLSKITMDFTLTEWWIVNGILTQAEGSEVQGEQSIIINGYYQVKDGYKPSPTSGNQAVKYSLTVSSSNMMTDRLYTTHPFNLAPTWGAGNVTSQSRVWIPAFESDYGILSMPGNNDFLSNNNPLSLVITIYSSTGAATTQTITLNGYDIEALPVYPANLNDWTGLTVKPSLFPNWRYYSVRVVNSLPSTVSVSYNFYNAFLHGQSDCWWDKIRLGWVNSRGGWDYFNFIKKSEKTDEIQRKQYKQVLFNGSTSVFSSNDRGKTDRRNLVEQVITATSDYITEGEFMLLRSLMVSNQVTWLSEDQGKPIEIPVNMDDTSYVEKKTRDGKLYNVTVKFRIANEYWT